MPYLNRPGATIYYDDTGGEGPPILTSHGYIENGTYWAVTGVTDALVESGYRVINVDLRGHGRSVPGEGKADYSIEAAVDDIGALAVELSFEKFHLLAHATGGISSARYAIANHERLLSFIVCNAPTAPLPVLDYAAPEWDDKEIPEFDFSNPGDLKVLTTPLMGELLRSGVSFNQIVADLRANPKRHILGAFFKGFATHQDPERCWRLAEQIYSTNNPILCAEFADQFYKDPDPHVKGLRQISCPSLVLAGEYDYLLLGFCEQFARNIPGAEYVILDKVGHMTAIEDPERTIAAILGFLSRVDEKGKE